MIRIYFDSSAYVKVFDTSEEGSTEAIKIIDYAEKNKNYSNYNVCLDYK